MSEKHELAYEVRFTIDFFPDEVDYVIIRNQIIEAVANLPGVLSVEDAEEVYV